MNTQNTFLRFAAGDEPLPDTKPIFVSIAETFYSGLPIDPESGEELVADLELYRMVSPNKYQKIA